MTPTLGLAVVASGLCCRDAKETTRRLSCILHSVVRTSGFCGGDGGWYSRWVLMLKFSVGLRSWGAVVV